VESNHLLLSFNQTLEAVSATFPTCDLVRSLVPGRRDAAPIAGARDIGSMARRVGARRARISRRVVRDDDAVFKER
jgi:hypothetical protein